MYEKKEFHCGDLIEVEMHHRGNYGAPGKKREKKKKATPKRLPHRASTSHTNYSSIATVSRSPTSANAVARKPRRADDREYMNYRNCPDCHSENEINRQVIFKLAPHQFVCTVCGNKFNF